MERGKEGRRKEQRERRKEEVIIHPYFAALSKPLILMILKNFTDNKI